MKRIYNKDTRLESHFIFPFVAWGLIIAFALFVYTMVTDFAKTAAELKEQSTAKEERAKTPIEEITDFENLNNN